MMTRKQFLHDAIGVTAAALGLHVLGACTGGTSTSTSRTIPDAGAAGNCLQNGTAVTITANHGHVLVVSKEDVAAMAAKSYDIMGTADHTHTVSLAAADFAQLAADHAIMTTSTINTSPTFGTHSHPVLVACA